MQMPNKGDLFREFLRILRPGGRYVGIDWHCANALGGIENPLYAAHAMPINYAYDLTLRSPEEYEALFVAAGFVAPWSKDCRELDRLGGTGEGSLGDMIGGLPFSGLAAYRYSYAASWLHAKS